MVRKYRKPSPQENRKINRGILQDAENPEWTPADFQNARAAKDVLPSALYASLVKRRGERGPQKAPRKLPVTIRVDPDTLERYRATGRGWQSRMNDVLRRGVGL